MKRLLLLLPLLLFGCSDGGGPGEFDRMITGITSGGAGAASRAIPQQAPANVPATGGVMALEQIQRGAVTAADCQRHLARLGPGWRLVETRPNDLGVGGVLAYICIFEQTRPSDDTGAYDDPYNR